MLLIFSQSHCINIIHDLVIEINQFSMIKYSVLFVLLILFCQVFNEINSREIDKINVFVGLFNNWAFVTVMASTVMFQVIIVELLGDFANTVHLSWQLWLISFLIGSLSLIVAIILKCIPVDPVRHTNINRNGYTLLPSGPEMV